MADAPGKGVLRAGAPGKVQPAPGETSIPTAPEHDMLDLRYPSDPIFVGSVRSAFEEFASRHGMRADDVDAVKVALAEACSNAVCHGSPDGAGSHFRAVFRLTSETLVIEVADEGAGFVPEDVPAPLPAEECKPSGRGLFLMQALMDQVEIEPSSRGTCVRLTKHLVHREG